MEISGEEFTRQFAAYLCRTQISKLPANLRQRIPVSVPLPLEGIPSSSTTTTPTANAVDGVAVKLTLDPLHLQYLNAQFLLHQHLLALPIDPTTPTTHIDHLRSVHGYLQVVTKLRLAPVGKQKIRTDPPLPQPISVDLAPFSSLRHLELVQVSPDALLGLELVQNQLASVTCQRVLLRDPSQIFITPIVDGNRRRKGKDKATGVVPLNAELSEQPGELRKAISSSSVQSIFTWNTTMDPSFAEYDWWPRLDSIDLSHNTLTDLDSNTMQRLTRCSSLNCSHNTISKLPPALRHLFRLHRLSLAQNLLDSVSEIYTLLGNITSLDLRQNQLTSTKGLEKLWSLTDLDLAHNKISDISELLALTRLPELYDLRFIGNPVHSQANARRKIFGAFGARAVSVRLDGSAPSFRERIALRLEGTLKQSEPGVIPRKSTSTDSLPSALEALKAIQLAENNDAVSATESRGTTPIMISNDSIFGGGTTIPDADQQSQVSQTSSSAIGASSRSQRSRRRGPKPLVRNVEIEESEQIATKPPTDGPAAVSSSLGGRRRLLQRIPVQPPRGEPNAADALRATPVIRRPGGVRSDVPRPKTVHIPTVSSSPAVVDQVDEFRKRIATLKDEAGTGWLKAYREMNNVPSLQILSASPVEAPKKVQEPFGHTKVAEEDSIKGEMDTAAAVPVPEKILSPPVSTVPSQNGFHNDPGQSKPSPPVTSPPSRKGSPAIKKSRPVSTAASLESSKSFSPVLPPLPMPSRLRKMSFATGQSTCVTTATTTSAAVLSSAFLTAQNTQAPVILGPILVDRILEGEERLEPRQLTIGVLELTENGADCPPFAISLSHLYAIERLPYNALCVEFRRSRMDIVRLEYRFRRREDGLADDQYVRQILDRLEQQVQVNVRNGLEATVTFRFKCLACGHEFSVRDLLPSMACRRCMGVQLVDISPDVVQGEGSMESPAITTAKRLYEAEMQRELETAGIPFDADQILGPSLSVYLKLNVLQTPMERIECWIPCSLTMLSTRRRFGSQEAVRERPAFLMLTSAFCYILETTATMVIGLGPAPITKPSEQLRKSIVIAYPMVHFVEVDHQRQFVTMTVTKSGRMTFGEGVPDDREPSDRFVLTFLDSQRCTAFLELLVPQMEEAGAMVRRDGGIPRINQDRTQELGQLIQKHVEMPAFENKSDLLRSVFVYCMGRLAGTEGSSSRRDSASPLMQSAVGLLMRRRWMGAAGGEQQFPLVLVLGVADRLLLLRMSKSMLLDDAILLESRPVSSLDTLVRIRRHQEHKENQVAVYGIRLEFTNPASSWELVFPTTRNGELLVERLQTRVADEGVKVGFEAAGSGEGL